MKPPMFIAEMSCSHLGSFDRAVEIIKAAAISGADAVKIQLWGQNLMVMDDTYVIQDGTWKDRNLAELYREAWTPWEWVPELFTAIKRLGMKAIASPFDPESVDWLEHCSCDIYKIASFELVDIPLIRKVVTTDKPVILSTGMASYQEISDAMACVFGMNDVTVLQCTSAYPARAEDMNLATMMEHAHPGVKIGLSDHSLDPVAAMAATALGATVIEKHFTVSRDDGGPDASFSLEPEEFSSMVQLCRHVAMCIGQPIYGPSKAEASSYALRRSLYIAQDAKAGDIMTMQNLRTARPALGLPPKHMPLLLGHKLSMDVKKGMPVTWEMVHDQAH